MRSVVTDVVWSVRVVWYGARFVHRTRHKTGHFGDVFPSQSLGSVLKKLNHNKTN